MANSDSIPEITVTMLGPSGSGKSTFLLGMYAVLSAGLSGYFLHARDRDQDLDLSEAWEALVDDGLLPPPTPEEGWRLYPFVFKQGLDPLLNIDWLDYRGGAIDDRTRTQESDTSQLTQRLDESDAIYLVVDGAKLEYPIDEMNVEAVGRATRSRRMTVLLQKCFENRRNEGKAYPALVVVITKSDLLADQVGGDEPAATAQAVAAVQALLPICFVNGVTTLVCPVSLGHFGYQTGGKVNVVDVDPKWLHKPILFSLLYYFDEVLAAVRYAAAQARESVQKRGRELTDTRPRWFSRPRLNKLRDGLETDIRHATDLDELERVVRACYAGLASQFGGLRLFRDGVPVHTGEVIGPRHG